MAEKKDAKICVKCGERKPLSEFSPNKLWFSQKNRDAWCDACAKKYCKDKETVAEYCFANNRIFNDAIWEFAEKKAVYKLNNDRVWLNPIANEAQRKKVKNLAEAQAFLDIRNTEYVYEYEENLDISNQDAPNQQAVQEFSDADDKAEYNMTWGGWFTKRQIEQLESKYAQYEDDFVLDNVNIRDYARKVVKASLNADIAEDRLRRGQGTSGEYKEAQKIFDDLSKSSNFAACRRKPGEAAGMGSLGEIILRLERDGYLDENPYVFPEDDIDKIILGFNHTLASIGQEIR